MEKNKLKRSLVVFLSLFFVVCCTILCVHIQKENKLDKIQQAALETLSEDIGTYDENTIVLNSTSRASAESLANKFGAKLRITSDGSFATLTLQNGMTVRDVYEDKENRTLLEKFSLDYYSKTSDVAEEESGADEGKKPSKPEYSVSDTLYKNQTYIDYVNIGAAWNTYKGSGVTVAVIDTGIDTDHIEFAGRISEYSYNATTDKIVKDYTKEDGSYDYSIIEDEQGHGTSVAGVIAAGMNDEGVVGIAPEVTLLVIKAECDENGSFYRTSDLVFGLNYAVERDADVVNMSFGAYTLTNPFARATKLAVDSDVICVAAAGNEGTSALCYPAADENVIAVGALKENGNELAEYSNFGEDSDVVAPGTTFTTKKGGGYGVSTGTSLASPIVAGAMALLKNSNKYIEFEQARELLYASCYDLGAKGDDWYFGYGAIDVSALTVEPRGTVTFDMLTDEIEDIEQTFILNHALQNIPEPTRTYSIFDGWYYDIDLKEELNLYEDVWTGDITLYAKWANEDDGVPYTYVTLDDGTVEIRSYTGKRRYITVPDKIYEKTVSSIGDFAFDGQTRLRQVNLPNTITNIGKFAFRNCNNLYALNLPDGVKTIDENAFENTVRLQNIGMNASIALEKVGDFAFKGSGLTRFDVTAKVSYLNGSAFFGTNSLKNFTVAKSNVNFTVFDGVLFNKTASKIVAYPAAKSGSYTIKDGVTSVGDYAFGYAKIKNIDLNNAERIGAYAFAYSALESLVISDNVVALDKGSFAYNFNLKTVTLGGGLAEIPALAFYMDGITELSIPKNIAVIGPNAFALNQIETLVFEENSGLLEIGEAAFSYIPVQKVKFPASLVVIGAKAFAKDGYLAEITFEENSNLQYIGSYAFEKTSFTSVTFPDGLVGIGDYAFISSALTGEVTLPASLKTLGAGAFASCGQLTQISVEESNETYVSVNGVVYTLDKTTLVAYPAGNAASEYSLLESTLVVADSAFYGAENLTQITLDEALTAIERYAFYSVVKLGKISIPDNVVQISNYAFAGDYNLGYINFTQNSKLPRISYAAFADSGVYSMRIPASVSTMAQEAFAGCNNLQSVTFAAGSKLDFIPAYAFSGANNLTQVTFETGSALTAVSAHGFEGAKKLTTVNFGGANVARIDNYAFRYCESLTTIGLPEGLKEIGRFAFYGCKSLTRLDIPESLERIGRYAFYGAENLNIFFAAESLPEYLQESWDDGIVGYYVGVKEVLTSGDWNYATLGSGGVSIVKYTGSETELDLTILDLGGDIKQIGGYAFYNSDITSIILPATLESIQRYAFAYSALENIQIPAYTSFIGQYAFFNTSLKTVTFAENSTLKKIEKYAFSFDKYLESFALPASVSEIGSYILYNSGVKTLTFAADSSLETISAHAFASTAIESVILPDSVNYIDDNAFRDSVYLKSVTFGAAENLQVHSNAFYNTGLTSLYLPANLSYVGEYAFIGLKDLTAYAVADENPRYKSINGVLYSKDSKKLIAYPAGKTGNFTVPKEVETIGFGAFENSLIEAVSFEDGINLLTIGYRAFYKSEKLASVSIPESVVSIDFYAFAECRNLERVTFAENNKLTGIYEGAFLNCSNLTDIIIPDNIVEVSDFAFYGCRALTKLPFSETSEVKGIYDYAFAYTSIQEFVAPNTLKEIGKYAFYGTELGKFVLNSSVETIGYAVLKDVKSIVSIVVPFMGEYEGDLRRSAVLGWWFGVDYSGHSDYVPSSLTDVTVLSGEIISYAFFHSKINNIKLGEGITAVGENAFALSDLKSIDFSKCVNLGVIGKNSFDSCSQLTYVDLSNCSSLQTIEDYAFFCTGLKEIKFSDSIQYIKDSAVRQTAIKTIEFPLSLLFIGNTAFGYNGLLKTVDLTRCSKLKEIGELAFSHTNIETIKIGESVEKIDIGVFSGCDSLTDVFVDTNNAKYCDIGGVLFDKEQTTVLCYPSGKDASDYALPETVEIIGDYAFENAKIKRIDFSGKLKSISHFAFKDSSLRFVELPENISVEAGAFWNCGELEVVNIPLSWDTIESQQFMGCSSLKQVIIPENIKVIGADAFAYCVNLTILFESENLPVCYDRWNQNIKAYYLGCESIEEWGDYLIALRTNGTAELLSYSGSAEVIDLAEICSAKNVTRLGYGCFSKSNITKITIPAMITELGERSFYDCRDLQEVIFSDESQIKTMPKEAFSRCTKLTTIVLPQNLTVIDQHAFEYCAFEEIVLPMTLETIGDFAFMYSKLKKLEIPDSVENIGSYALSYTRNLVNVVGGRGIENLGNYAFESSLWENNENNYEAGFLYLEKWLVSGKYAKGEVKIKSGITHIAAFAFFENKNINKVYIGKEIEFIGCNAFCGCDDVNFLYFDATSCTDCESAFGKNTTGATVVFGKDVKYIPNGLFQAANIKSILFEEGSACETIETNAFIMLQNLEYLILPDCVKSMVNLYGCYNLKVVKANTDTLVALPDDCIHVESIILNSGNDYIDFIVQRFNGMETKPTFYINEDRNSFEWGDYSYLGGKYYSGEWIVVEYFVEENLFMFSPMSVSSVIINPGVAVKKADEGVYRYTFAGWDTNNDGQIDNLPTTSTSDITAKAIFDKDFICAFEGHSGGQATCEKKAVCRYCGTEYGGVLGHDYSEEWIIDKDATCAENGSKSHHCTRCDKVSDITVIGALGHNYIHHEAKAATCVGIGWNAYDTCSRCNYTTYKEISMKGHTKSIAIKENIVEATCLENGHYDSVVYCSVCNDELSREEKTIEALGHNYIHHEAQAATCTAIGWNAYDTCSRCDYTTYKEIPAKGHTKSNAIKENVVEATCLENGHYDSVVYCPVCNDELSRVEKTIDALGHNYIHHEAKAATCTAIGWNAYDTCSRCNYTTYKEIAAEGHTAGDYIVDYDSTCESAGSKHKECKKCGKVLEKAQIAAKGHEYGEWTVDIEPTVNAEGREYRKCVRCEHREERSVEKLKNEDDESSGCLGTLDLTSVVMIAAIILICGIFVKVKSKKSDR